MNQVVAVLSMLDQTADRADSATRVFRKEPVLWWTLQRIRQARQITHTAILCWEDQLSNVEPIAADHKSHMLVKGPRVAIAQLDAVTAARKWSDGWRGGLMATCDFDRGFYAPWVAEICQRLACDGVMLIDPSAGLVDPQIIDAMIDHARNKPDQELYFTQAAPGLGGALLRPSLVQRLAAAITHPGRLLHYSPDVSGRDPIGLDGCVPVPTPVARSVHRFTLDSDRQINRIGKATISLNGQLITSEAEQIVQMLQGAHKNDALPREVVLELNTARAIQPIYWPGKHLNIDRGPMELSQYGDLFAQLAQFDDMRLTLGGVGDPLMMDNCLAIIQSAHAAGINAIHVETDLLSVSPNVVEALVDSPVDVVSVHLPALTQKTYAAIMGTDALPQVINNLKQLLDRRQQRKLGSPLVVPVFTKCRENLAEMELWYDQWIRAVGSALIIGPTDYAGQIPDAALADMSPPARCACRRINQRMTILCDGRIVPCEQDVLGTHVLGQVGIDAVQDVWDKKFGALRQDHQNKRWDVHPRCAACREWHRP